SNVFIDFVIIPIPTLEPSNLSPSIICIGQDSIIQITGATNLPHGNYEFLWTISNAVPSTGSTGPITITNGSGEFTIPGSVFPAPDTYVLTITAINSELSPCDNLSPNLQTIINVLPLPSIDAAQVVMGVTCLNSEITVSIANASNLSDATYQLTYTLAGTISNTATIPVDFTAGAASFTLPAANFSQIGAYTLTIADILSQTTTICGTFGNSFPPTDFTLAAVGPPQLIDLGNTFCDDITATVADLTANVVGTPNVNWYDAPVGGNLIDPSTPLVDGGIYYGEQILGSGCASDIRLEVTVEIINCNELVIPDGFSPNGDGINDNFIIKNIRDLYPAFTLEVFNRYGTVLYTGDISSPDWDGAAQKGAVIGDSKLPAGVYFFIINFNDGVRSPYQGRVYLNR
uniref:T9SS type B sorting domain-containing protein n=1 Tax=Flavobacterium sp. TaxID=239 RepID=UPI0037C1270D